MLKKKQVTYDVNIINARYYIVNKITDIIIVIFWSLASTLLSFIPFIPLYAYINAINAYEYRLTHILKFRSRLRYLHKHIIWMLILGYPTAVIQCSNMDWFVKNHIAQYMMYNTVIIIWLL